MLSSKMKGQKQHTYPQPEGILGEAMCKYGKDLGENSNFCKWNTWQCKHIFWQYFLLAQSLIEMGEALKEMAEVKYALEDNVKQNFLEPLTHLQTKDLKDVLVSLSKSY